VPHHPNFAFIDVAFHRRHKSSHPSFYSLLGSIFASYLYISFYNWVNIVVTDEDQQKIQSSADRKQLDEVYTRVYRTLKNGITVGGRHFEFLAFGNSQLRDHGCYMFNSDEHLSAEMIREWMGIFDGIKSVAKYAGRNPFPNRLTNSKTWTVLFDHTPCTTLICY
jgi:hypothetical protein